MYKRVMSVLLVIVILTFSALSLQAQDDFTEEELENIAVVSDAYDKMAALETVLIEGVQTLTQEITTQGQTLEIILVQEMTGATIYDDETPAADMTIEQIATTSLGFQEIVLEMTMDMVQVDGSIYAQVRDVTPEFAAQYPSGWVNLSENAAAMPGMEMFNVDQMSNVANTGLQYPMTEETIAFIEELENFEEIEGIETRVFALTFDTEALLQTEAFDVLSGMMDADALGLDVEEMMTQMFDGATFDLVLWVGVDDGFIHRTDLTLLIDAELNIPGAGNANLVQDMAASFFYTEFDEPVDIVAPID